MADEKTRADAIRVYLTGAASDGAAQADPNLALGDYRSSSEAEQLGIAVTNPISNVTVDFAAGANGTGNGTLTASAVNDLKWTPPGGSQGAAVTIANGETKILEGGTDPEKYIRVTRTSATDLSGTATVALADVFNNLAGLDNVSSAEASAGDTEYRCLCFKNEAGSGIIGLKAFLALLGTAGAVNSSGYATGAVTVTIKSGDYTDWPDSGYVENEDTGEVMYYSSRTSTALTVPAAGRDIWDETGGGIGVGDAGSEDDVLNPIAGLRIAKEAPSSQSTGNFTDETGNGEGTQPAGLTWEHPTSAADGDVITIGDMAAGYIYGLWLERKVPASTEAEATVLQHIKWTYEAA